MTESGLFLAFTMEGSQDIEVLCSSTYRLRPNLRSTSLLYLSFTRIRG